MSWAYRPLLVGDPAVAANGTCSCTSPSARDRDSIYRKLVELAQEDVDDSHYKRVPPPSSEYEDGPGGHGYKMASECESLDPPQPVSGSSAIWISLAFGASTNRLALSER